MTSQARYDVVIVGARCAGATLATFLARAGASVLRLDKERLPPSQSRPPLCRDGSVSARLSTVVQRTMSTMADTVFLLTTTAEGFFPRFGFEQITRDEVPPSVRGSVEFQSACPASAIVMRRQLR
jgi:choline dehydrogenase-like flavoprotein